MRRTARTLGEILVTLGVVLLLYVVWEIGFLAVVDGRAQASEVSSLQQQFSAPAAAGSGGSAGSPGSGVPANLTDGTAFAIVHIPRLGADWAKPVYEGVGLDVLAKGLGHYPSTQLPGEVGNVAIAGHRAGHGNPLIDIDAIQDGDVMVIETAAGWYVYTVQSHKVVPPTDVAVIAPVPEQPGATPTQRSFTLTSCDPRYGHTNRWIVFSTMTRFVARADGPPAELSQAPATAGGS